MNNYCTYFDKNYLSRGLCLYDSLVRESKNNFHLFILAFDDTSFNFFKKRKYKNITCVHHSEFEDSTLLRIKTLRTKVEYFWTCTPSIILFFLKKYKLKQCIYLDSDIFFFDDPQNIIREHDNYSVSITSHNYYYLYDQNLTSGKYCVQFMIFNNDKISLNILKWWQAKCNKWCYNRVEKNRFGDQKYLDSWPKRFKKVNVINNLGAGVAPWNVQRFEITKEKKISITENKIKNILNFYHFHDLKFL